MSNWASDEVNEHLFSENIRERLQQVNSEMKNNIRSEMKDIKERLDTLTASLEENKEEGQLLCWRDTGYALSWICVQPVLLTNLANLNILIKPLVGPIFLCSDLSRSSTYPRFVSFSATKTRQEVKPYLVIIRNVKKDLLLPVLRRYDSGLEACRAGET